MWTPMPELDQSNPRQWTVLVTMVVRLVWEQTGAATVDTVDRSTTGQHTMAQVSAVSAPLHITPPVIKYRSVMASLKMIVTVMLRRWRRKEER